MNRYLRLLALSMVVVYSTSLAILPVYAQSVTATFALSPRTKTVLVNTNFDVTINIKATATKKVSYARAVVFFDPTMLEIPQALEAGSMFCNYPTDEANYVADNEQGQVLITGISTGDSGCAFPDVTTANSLFAKITFKAKKAGTANLSFAYNGELEDEMSAITDSNSPSQFIMTSPQDGKYTIVSSLSTPTPQPPSNLGVDPRVVIGAAAVVMGIGWYMYPKGKSQTSRVVASTEGW
ncbi:hypothetical protein IT418_02050 [bacterium]|nr:hypothetical protein [bacterium]